MKIKELQWQPVLQNDSEDIYRAVQASGMKIIYARGYCGYDARYFVHFMEHSISLNPNQSLSDAKIIANDLWKKFILNQIVGAK